MTEPLRLQIAAPCEDCIHSPVCSVKALLATSAAQYATLALPDILGGLSNVEISLRHGSLVFADCSQFIDASALKPPRKARTRAKLKPQPRLTASGKRVGRPPKVAPLQVVEGWSPLCMDGSEWAEWQRLNPRLPAVSRAARPCEDCPAEYAAEMLAQGRCNGTPAVAA